MGQMCTRTLLQYMGNQGGGVQSSHQHTCSTCRFLMNLCILGLIDKLQYRQKETP